MSNSDVLDLGWVKAQGLQWSDLLQVAHTALETVLCRYMCSRGTFPSHVAPTLLQLRGLKVTMKTELCHDKTR